MKRLAEQGGRFMFHNSSQSLALAPRLQALPTGLGNAPRPPAKEVDAPMSALVPYFLLYCQAELQLARETLEIYARGLAAIVRIIGNLPPGAIAERHVRAIKEDCAQRGTGPARVSGLLAALKAFLRFSREALGIATLDPASLHGPKMPRREVVFLAADEVERFVEEILVPNKHMPLGPLDRLCFRALVEVILGSGLRLSEALSLTRSSIDAASGEARVVGKGNKERAVFFSERALRWVERYLAERTDTAEALFVSRHGKPIKRHTAILWFRWFRLSSDVGKKITAHILRHTVATTLLFNGCPMGHVKEILGHERLQTTCAYYLGADKRAAKEAFLRCLHYGRSAVANWYEEALSLTAPLCRDPAGAS